LKRKYDDSDVSEYDDSEGDSEDDFDDDDDPPPPPKKRKHVRSSEGSTGRIKKSLKAKLIHNMSQFENELLTHGGFGPKQWGQLYDQMNDDDYIREHNVYVRELFFSDQNKRWRREVLADARDIIAPNRHGHVSQKLAKSALEIGKTAPFTSTILLDADDEANDVAIADLVRTLEEFRKGNNDFEPPSNVASSFAKGDMDKAREFVIREYNSIMAHTGGCYAYESAKELAAEVKKKYGLSSSFPTFAVGSYVAPISFTSAEVIEEMNELPREGLDAKIRSKIDTHS
jgi:hypothetical protein